MDIDVSQLTSTDRMQGEDEEGTRWLKDALADAKQYVQSFPWCRGVRESYLGVGVADAVAAFLMHIDPAAGADEWLWIVVGDLPSAYVSTEAAPSPPAALLVYCELMEGWVEAVRAGGKLDDVFPVEADATEENAEALEERIQIIREDIVPAFFEEEE